MIRYGIDVCSYQGDINWKKVKDVGVDFAVLKCIMRGLGPDAKFAANVRGCRENGIPISIYTYVYEDTVEGAENRARAAVNACKEQGLKGCTIWWDVEDKTIRKTGVNARAKLTKSVAAARAIITAAGYTFGVYCDADFYTSCLNAHELGGKWWIAKYGGNPVTTFPGKPAAKKPTIANEMCGWQYCSRGRVAGIKGSVDLNISYDDDFLIGKQEVKKSATGNPYKAPDLIVTSDLQARIKHVTFYTSAGEGVRHVQYELHRLGYNLGPSGVDGKAGKMTVAAITLAQEEFKITVDGLGGKETLSALHSAKQRPQKKAAAKTTATTKKQEHIATVDGKKITIDGKTLKVFNQHKLSGEYASNLSSNGCGACCTAFALQLNGKNISPAAVVKKALSLWGKWPKGCLLAAPGIATVLKGYGIPAKYYPTTDRDACKPIIDKALKAGKSVIVWTDDNGLKGDPYAKGQHYVFAVGYDKDGKVVVANSGGKGPVNVTSLDTLVKFIQKGTGEDKHWWRSVSDSAGIVVVG